MQRNQKTLIFVVLFSFLSISSASGALEVSDISISPSIVWLHEHPDVTISAQCLLDGSNLPNATAHADIYPPGSKVSDGPSSCYQGILWFCSGSSGIGGVSGAS